MNLRYVFTGGPGAGKTTVLDLLKKNGFTCIPEVAREIINNRLSNGLNPRPDATQFANQILAKDIDQYDKFVPENKPVFFDRGIGDALYMLHQCGEIQIAEATSHLNKRPYNKMVFIFPPWHEIYTTDAERDQTYEDSIEVYDRLWLWYLNLDFSVIQVPLSEPEQRMEFIINSIENAQQ